MGAATECCVFVGIRGAPRLTEACLGQTSDAKHNGIWWRAALAPTMFTEPQRFIDPSM